MSTRAEEFVAVLKSDPQLQSQIVGATTAEDRKQIVTDAGFGDVSSADAKAAIDGESSGELSDDQLGAASGAGGGFFSQTMWSDPGYNWDDGGW
jgi:predicted ribosomally synthesized peptide with nif11-like leader